MVPSVNRNFLAGRRCWAVLELKALQVRFKVGLLNMRFCTAFSQVAWAAACVDGFLGPNLESLRLSASAGEGFL